MAERIPGRVSVLVGVQPWRSVDVQFPETEPPPAEVEKMATAAGDADMPTSSEDGRVYRVPAKA